MPTGRSVLLLLLNLCPSALLTDRCRSTSPGRQGDFVADSPNHSLQAKNPETIGPRLNTLMHAKGTECDMEWESWGAVHSAGILNGNVIVYSIFTSVGNMFIVLKDLITVRRLSGRC